MALRDQPYFPLFVQDFLSDEKLCECSAESTGVYIRLMCIMHKSKEYGTVLLKQKDKQNPSIIKNFADKLARMMPYSPDVIERSLEELLEEDVIGLDGDTLFQKRMVRDGKLSDTRASAARKRNSASKKTKLADDFAGAKTAANTEYEYEYENDNEIIERDRVSGEEEGTEKEAAPQPAVSVGYPCKPADVQCVVEAWNSLNLQRVRKVPASDSKVGRMLRSRIREYGVETVLEAVEKVRASDFLMGRTGSKWSITLEWFSRPNNFPKVIDGNYDNKRPPDNTGGTGNPFIDSLREDGYEFTRN